MVLEQAAAPKQAEKTIPYKSKLLGYRVCTALMGSSLEDLKTAADDLTGLLSQQTTAGSLAGQRLLKHRNNLWVVREDPYKPENSSIFKTDVFVEQPVNNRNQRIMQEAIVMVLLKRELAKINRFDLSKMVPIVHNLYAAEETMVSTTNSPSSSPGEVGFTLEHYSPREFVTLSNAKELGFLTTKDIVAICTVLAEYIDELNKLGILHLDLKPDNILIEYDWVQEPDEKTKGTRWVRKVRYESDGKPVVKVIDYGLAQSSTKPIPADLSGTPRFMSPERLRTNNEGVTVLSEQFTLALMLVYLLTGTSLYELMMLDEEVVPPKGEFSAYVGSAGAGFENEDVELLWEPIEYQSSITGPKLETLMSILKTALQSNPELRYSSTTKFAQALKKIT